MDIMTYASSYLRRRRHQHGLQATTTVSLSPSRLIILILIIPFLLPISLPSASLSSQPYFLTPTATPSSLTSLSVIAPILGESALIDKQTGRVYWQGGRPNFLESMLLYPYWDNRTGVTRHVRSTVLSVLVWSTIFGALARYIRRKCLLKPDNSNKYIHLLLTFSTCLLNAFCRTPILPPRLVVLLTILYLYESYRSSTRQYLTHTLTSPKDVETYVEKLREMSPCVSWEARCFHYERRNWAWECISCWMEKVKDKTTIVNGQDEENNNDNGWLMGSFPAKKVVTHCSSKKYEFRSWKDDTVAGIWKQALSTSTTSTVAPFAKLKLSKVLLLADAKARKDYFRQQSEFIMREGRKDAFTEFSTNIQVKGFKPKLLVVRPTANRHCRFFRLIFFWAFTLVGLTLPYRIWFSRQCDELCMMIVKETSTGKMRIGHKEDRDTDPSWFLTLWDWFGSGNTEWSGQKYNGRAEIFRQRMKDIAIYEMQKVLDPLKVEIMNNQSCARKKGVLERKEHKFYIDTRVTPEFSSVNTTMSSESEGN